MPEDQLDECPWSIAFDLSEGHVLMPMVWSKADETSKIIVDLAKKHGLVCFDPQSTQIITAPRVFMLNKKPGGNFGECSNSSKAQ